MTSLYRGNNILRSKTTEIKGTVNLKSPLEGEEFNLADRLFKEKEDIQKEILEAKQQLELVIEETKNKRQMLIDQANEDAKSIEKKAYEAGYEQGMKNGYEDGYKESYEANIDKAMKECQAIKDDAYKTLVNLKSETKDYMKLNNQEVLRISIAIAEQVLREEFKQPEVMSRMISNVIEEYDLKSDLVIKVNELYLEELNKKTEKMSLALGLSQKIFVISDSEIEKGNAEIETKNGKLTIGIDSVLDKVKSELL